MGELVQFVKKTAAEERGLSNGHKFRENTPAKIATDFYEACWDEAKEEAAQDPANNGNIARLCVQTETLAMQFIKAGIVAYHEKGNAMATDTAEALQKLTDARFPNGSQLRQKMI